MRILLAHNYYQQSGGEDIVFNAEARLLQLNGHDVECCFMHNDSIRNMNSIQIGMKTFWNPDGFKLIEDAISSYQPDLVHFHNTFPLLSPAAYEAAYQHHVPVIQTLHNFRLICLNATFVRDGKLCEKCLGRTPPLPGIRYRCYHHSLPASLTLAGMLTYHRLRKTWQRKVNAYICLSATAKEKFIEAGLPSEKLFVKPNFTFAKPRLVMTGERSYFLFVGRLSPEKGLATLLNALRGQSLPVKIVGQGPMESQVREFLAAAHTEQCQYYGQVSHDQVLELMKGAIALVLPSLWFEGFPMILAEAFSQGTPVIASDLGIMAEILDEHRVGFKFHAGNEAELRQCLLTAWQQPHQMADLGHEAQKLYISKYSPEAAYQDIMEIYNQVTFAAGSSPSGSKTA